LRFTFVWECFLITFPSNLIIKFRLTSCSFRTQKTKDILAFKLLLCVSNSTVQTETPRNQSHWRYYWRRSFWRWNFHYRIV